MTTSEPKTALELARMVESMSPAALKTRLYDLLMWQHKYGKRPGHIRQYLEATYYTDHPRERQTPEAKASRAKFQGLAAGMGRSV